MNTSASGSLSWFKQKGIAQGIFWTVAVCLVSALNDLFTRYASRLPAMEITFFRYFFAVITLLPFIVTKSLKELKPKYPKVHALRSVLLFCAIACWSKAVSMTPLSAVSIFAQTVPLFVLPMAFIFLGEKLEWQRCIATLFGFIGIVVIAMGGSDTSDLTHSIINLNNGIFYLIGAALLFAFSDILNKQYVSQESNLSMLFYIALGTMICGAYPAYYYWVTPTLIECCALALLGAGGNLILFFILKAFAATDVSAITPYRYLEVLFAGLFGYAFFAEIPDQWTILGACVIIPSTFAVAYYETRVKKAHSYPENQNGNDKPEKAA